MKVERLKLDRVMQTKKLYKWLEQNSLTATEISLWHALMNIADEAGYPVWLSVPISRLSMYTGMKKDALYSARDSLESLGLIQIHTGKGNQAAQYRIVPFIDNYCQDEDDLYTEDENPSIDTDESTDIPPQEPPKEPQEEPKKVNIFRRIQTIIPMPSPMDIQTIKSYLDEGMEDQLLVESINIAESELHNKGPSDKWRYAKGIMRNWYNDGIRTLHEFQEHERKRKESMNNGGDKQHNRPIQPEKRPEPKPNGMREFRIPE